jgi:hypothetical protein
VNGNYLSKDVLISEQLDSNTGSQDVGMDLSDSTEIQSLVSGKAKLDAEQEANSTHILHKRVCTQKSSPQF